MGKEFSCSRGEDPAILDFGDGNEMEIGQNILVKIGIDGKPVFDCDALQKGPGKLICGNDEKECPAAVAQTREGIEAVLTEITE